MKDSLFALCDQFIANRDTVKAAFRMDNNYIFPVCANLFCARGRMAQAEALRRSRDVIRSQTGAFSHFRGNIKAPLACILSMSDSPEGTMARAVDNYTLLRNSFSGSEYLALAAFLLADLDRDAAGRAARGREIYRRMKAEHPFLTSSEDSVFAVFMAFSQLSDDRLIEDMEAVYRLVKTRFKDSNCVQTVSHVLTLSPGAPEGKVQRLFALYDALENAGGKYGKHYQLATLAALSAADADIRTLTEDILDVDYFLENQKGYGFFGLDRRTRLMHAAMIVSDQYTLRESVDQAALAGTLSMIIAQQMACCAAACAASSASSAAAAH